ncbi:tripartite tricarboxylate transporter substrate binding protein [Sediminicoccus sp. KRV36]|uniref:Bug family tripartite tricarboxylate transporter substrate binding protein n=1 Tax=Sediminicoccus sp. KRV36 TaxID=3133721 RepID=UPI00200F8248|nr:tripartite tricarboxylate transporter substrate binding protein [Sediminicoccus rosea]UPY35148.1 tripartite tricarboxylate transporter substrate binding protein [Sediminicoccus rosea]
MDQSDLPAALTRRGVLAAGGLLPFAAQAQAWPTRSISLVAPLAAGSSVDIMARLLAEQWSLRLGVPVPVENRPAANGTVALGQAARAAPDGYTAVITGQTSVAFNPHLYAALPYDPFRDFAYIGRIAGVSNALVVRAGSPFRSLDDLLAAARAQPGRLTYSSGGVGSTHHLSSALLAQQAGVEFTHVPYRGAPQGILAAQTGEVDFAYYNISTLLTGIRSGALRPLAVTSARRSPFLAEVPTMRELGFPNYEMTTWIGVATVAATPAPILARMEEVTRAMLEDASVQRRLGELGFELLPPVASADMLALIRAEHERWGVVIRASGARLE